MEFYSSVCKRPVRLSDATRLFAYESLNHRYGLDTKKTMAVTLDNVKDFETLSPLERYNYAITSIAKEAPIRICDAEKISGSATLGAAIIN